MSGPKRNPDKLNTIGIVVVGICGAVLVYVTIVALQAFYVNDTWQVNKHISMNLGQAVAVCLYEITRNTAAKPKPEKHVPARAEDVERIHHQLAEILEHTGYIHDPEGGTMHLKLRRLVHRMDLNAQDANLWMGMLRKIKWKLLS